MNYVNNTSEMINTLSKTEKSKNLAKFKKPELGKTINKVLKIDFLISRTKIAFLYL